jgi:hypothetical protein
VGRSGKSVGSACWSQGCDTSETGDGILDPYDFYKAETSRLHIEQSLTTDFISPVRYHGKHAEVT